MVTVDGAGLSEAERRRLARFLRPLPITNGTITVSRDWAGRRRISFTGSIPEPTRQVIRNIVGNLAQLRSSYY